MPVYTPATFPGLVFLLTRTPRSFLVATPQWGGNNKVIRKERRTGYLFFLVHGCPQKKRARYSSEFPLPFPGRKSHPEHIVRLLLLPHTTTRPVQRNPLEDTRASAQTRVEAWAINPELSACRSRWLESLVRRYVSWESRDRSEHQQQSEGTQRDGDDEHPENSRRGGAWTGVFLSRSHSHPGSDAVYPRPEHYCESLLRVGERGRARVADGVGCSPPNQIIVRS